MHFPIVWAFRESLPNSQFNYLITNQRLRLKQILADIEKKRPRFEKIDKVLAIYFSFLFERMAQRSLVLCSRAELGWECAH